MFHLHLLTTEQLNAKIAAGKTLLDDVEAAGKNVIEAAYVAAKDTPIGEVVAKSIADAKEKGVPILERLEHVVEDAAPTVVSILSGHGVQTAITDVESWVRGFAQTEFNRLESTTAPEIAADILRIFAPAAPAAPAA